MKIVKDIVVNQYNDDLEEKLLNMKITAGGLDYSVEKISGGGRNAVLFTPKKEWSMYYNSFAPTVEVVINNSKLILTCYLAKIIRIMMIAFFAFVFIFIVAGVFVSLKGRDFVPGLFLIPIGMSVFMFLLTKIGFFLSVKSFIKNFQEKLKNIR